MKILLYWPKFTIYMMHTLHKHTLSWRDTPRLEAWVIDNNTGVGSHCLLQGILLIQGLNQGLLHCRQILYCLSHQTQIMLRAFQVTENNYLNSQWQVPGHTEEWKLNCFKQAQTPDERGKEGDTGWPWPSVKWVTPELVTRNDGRYHVS